MSVHLLDRQHNYFELAGESLKIAERIKEIKNGGPYLSAPEVQDMLHHLGLYQSYDQNFAANGGPETLPVFPALGHDPLTDKLYLRSPVQQPDGAYFMPTDGVLITDTPEKARIDAVFQQDDNTIFMNSIHVEDTELGHHPGAEP